MILSEKRIYDEDAATVSTCEPRRLGESLTPGSTRPRMPPVTAFGGRLRLGRHRAGGEAACGGRVGADLIWPELSSAGSRERGRCPAGRVRWLRPGAGATSRVA